MVQERLYVYFKLSADDALACRAAWLQAAQQLQLETPGLRLECLERSEAGTAGTWTWMEIYSGLPLPQLRLASQAMAQALPMLTAPRHHEVFAPTS
jgi:Domain of unknown function (DUF4936)